MPERGQPSSRTLASFPHLLDAMKVSQQHLNYNLRRCMPTFAGLNYRLPDHKLFALYSDLSALYEVVTTMPGDVEVTRDTDGVFPTLLMRFPETSIPALAFQTRNWGRTTSIDINSIGEENGRRQYYLGISLDKTWRRSYVQGQEDVTPEILSSCLAYSGAYPRRSPAVNSQFPLQEFNVLRKELCATQRRLFITEERQRLYRKPTKKIFAS